MNNTVSSYKKWLPALIVVVAIPLAWFIIDSGKIEKRPKKHFSQQKKARIVNVTPIKRASVFPKWHASGIVKASEAVRIVAEVSGKVAQINHKATPGSLLEAGEWLVKLDQTDFRLALKAQQAQLVQAEANLALEQADQILAREELSLIEDIEQNNMDKTLILREPQLRSSQARVDIAKTNVEKGQVALKRTSVLMPFRGKITQKATGRGGRVSQNTTLFEVVNVERFWLEVKIPRSFLTLLDKKKPAILSQEKLWGSDQSRKARIVSVLPELDSRDRQVKLLLAIDDPLLISSKKPAKTETTVTENSIQPPVFINDFINVELTGKQLNKAWTIKNHWLQPDNTIWVVDSNNTLQKRAVTILFKGKEVIYIDADILKGDRALSEKPGIATVGLPVFPKNPDLIDKKHINPEDFIKNNRKNNDLKRQFKEGGDKGRRQRGDRG